MKSPRWMKQASLALLLLSSCYSIGAFADLPSGKFACQVITESGQMGLVLARAESKEVAEKIVLGAQAYTTAKVNSVATSVIQCIRRGDQQFSDKSFQTFSLTVPM